MLVVNQNISRCEYYLIIILIFNDKFLFTRNMFVSFWNNYYLGYVKFWIEMLFEILSYFPCGNYVSYYEMWS